MLREKPLGTMWHELCWKNNYVYFISYSNHIEGVFVYMHKRLQTRRNINSSDRTEVQFHGGYFLLCFFLLSKMSITAKNYLLSKGK